MIGRALLPAALSAAFVASGWVLVQHYRLAALQAKYDALEERMASCSARSTNINEDKASDHEIDQIPDADLSDAVDPRWVLP